MLQYKISFYRNGKDFPEASGVYYREFYSYKDMKEWANDTLNNDSLYARYHVEEISIDEFLENT